MVGFAVRGELTRRESEVAELVATGKSNLAIAQALWLSERTVEHHIRSVLAKLEVKSRVEIATYVLRESPSASKAPSIDDWPLELTPFVNRTVEVAELESLIERRRLVTVTGSGGVGKTRTAFHVAARLFETYEDGARIVELARTDRPEHVAGAIARALGLPPRSQDDALENVVRSLKSKRCLLVIDNCEHVLDAAVEAIASILRRCPLVSIVATSRQPLGIAGEETYRLPSLELPVESGSGPVEARHVADVPAIALFVDRARAVDNRFALTDENSAAIVDICRRLDGIPLAIELAAGRIRVFTPEQLRARLEVHFAILRDGGRHRIPRHQTLQALVDWSYALLDDHERAVLCAVSVFAGVFSEEGAIRVAGDAALPESDVFESLVSLVDKSLVIAEPVRDAMRYRLLESTRSFAAERLVATGRGDAVAERHLRYLTDRFERLRAEADRRARNDEIPDALRENLNDVRTALARALSRADAVAGARLLAAIGRAWTALGLETEGAGLLEAYRLGLDAREPLLLARLGTALAVLRVNTALDALALEAASDAVARARESGDGPTRAAALRLLSVTLLENDRPAEAEAALAEAEGVPDVSNALRLELKRTRAVLSNARGDHERALTTAEEVVREHQRLGNIFDRAVAQLFLAQACFRAGQTRRAIDLLREAKPTFERRDDVGRLASTQVLLARYLLEIDDVEGSFRAASSAVRVFALREPDHEYALYAVEVLTLVHGLRGDVERSAKLLGYLDIACPAYRRKDLADGPFERAGALLRERMAPEQFAVSVSAGSELAPEAALALAIG